MQESPFTSPNVDPEAFRPGDGENAGPDPAHMARIGRKGGETVSQDRGHMEQIGKKGGMAAHAKRALPEGPEPA